MQAESRGERKKRVGEREKRVSGRETVTNITYHTNIIVTDIVMYVYRGVKTEEKRASIYIYIYLYNNRIGVR